MSYMIIDIFNSLLSLSLLLALAIIYFKRTILIVYLSVVYLTAPAKVAVKVTN